MIEASNKYLWSEVCSMLL